MAASGQPSNRWILSNASDELSSADRTPPQASSAADSSESVECLLDIDLFRVNQGSSPLAMIFSEPPIIST
jgi:hypothetical protein